MGKKEPILIDQDEPPEIGFICRSVVLATLPHSDPGTSHFVRHNGNYRLVLNSLPEIGLPYGVIPRLLLIWMTTEAVRTKRRNIELGDSLAGFLRQLGMQPRGGKRGDITRFKEQAKRLSAATAYFLYEDKKRDLGKKFNLLDEWDFSWDNAPDSTEHTKSSVTLSEGFYKAVIAHPVPIDLRAVRVIRRSPLALDIYCWLTHRMSYLKRECLIPWNCLQNQFGVSYPLTAQGKRDFKKKFLYQLKNVLLVYPQANVVLDPNGLILCPSKTHVKKTLRCG